MRSGGDGGDQPAEGTPRVVGGRVAFFERGLAARPYASAAAGRTTRRCQWHACVDVCARR